MAEDIPTDYPNLKELLADMFETLTASDGVGLAGPQIGKAIRVAVIDLDVLKEWRRAASRCLPSTRR